MIPASGLRTWELVQWQMMYLKLSKHCMMIMKTCKTSLMTKKGILCFQAKLLILTSSLRLFKRVIHTMPMSIFKSLIGISKSLKKRKPNHRGSWSKLKVVSHLCNNKQVNGCRASRPPHRNNQERIKKFQEPFRLRIPLSLRTRRCLCKMFILRIH